MGLSRETQLVLRALTSDDDAYARLLAVGHFARADSYLYSFDRAIELAAEQLRAFVFEHMIGDRRRLAPLGADVLERFLDAVDFAELARHAHEAAGEAA